MMRGIGRIFGAILMGGLLVSEAGAHTDNLSQPKCEKLPADSFFTSPPDGVTSPVISITAGGPVTNPASPRRGTDLTDEGDLDFFYAKITLPWNLVAGELRVFDNRQDDPTAVSDAVLCQGSDRTPRATSLTTYTAHDQSKAQESADTAEDAARTAITAPAPGDVDTESKAKTAYDSARTALNTAAKALTAAATALRKAGDAALTPEAKTAAGTAARNAELAAQTADNQYNGRTGSEDFKYIAPPTTSGQTTEQKTIARRDEYNDAREYIQGRGANASGLGLPAAADALEAAATALGNIDAQGHRRFEIRADVQPDDLSYILVAAAETAPDLAVAFHGAFSTSALSDALDPGDPNAVDITVTAPGLLTVETTGSTDTLGFVTSGANEIARMDGGGSGNNFKLYVPVVIGSYRLYVDGQTPTTEGPYTLAMDFGVAMGQVASVTAAGSNTLTEAISWTDDLDTPDDNQASPAIQTTSDTDYFVFRMGGTGQFTVQASNGTTNPQADTEGTIYGPPGIEVMSDTSGNGKHFRVKAIARSGGIYAVKVSGTVVGSYAVTTALSEIGAATEGELNISGTHDAPASIDCSDDDLYEICAVGATASFDTDRYLIEVETAGALYIRSTGDTDTYGTLLGPDGAVVARADGGGLGGNFRLAVRVTPGLYLLEVRGRTRGTQGVYGLRTSFVRGAEVEDPTTDPDTGTGTGTTTEVDQLNARIATLERELDECRDPVVTDAEGHLDNPADGGYRSGIGVISGWVCAAEHVTVDILRGGVVRDTLTVAYGTSRPDVPLNSACRNAHAGFGMTFNFNHLPEGEHTIRAYADDELIDEATFEVVHLTAFEATDRDRFLRLPDEVQERGECIVRDFPAVGEDTFLLWEESQQNFVIEDAG